MKKYAGVIIVTVAMLSSLVLVTFQSFSAKTVEAGGQVITPFSSFASSSSLLITSSSNLVMATNTARVYAEISNLSSFTIYCNVQKGAPAVAYSGWTIFASSTKFIRVDENPYRGAVTCIAPTGNASTTILEQ